MLLNRFLDIYEVIEVKYINLKKIKNWTNYFYNLKKKFQN
jgi:hypothetical protein